MRQCAHAAASPAPFPPTPHATRRLTVFINNAGVSAPGCIHKGVAEAIKPMDEGWDTTLATNLTAGVVVLNALAPAMVERGAPRRRRRPVAATPTAPAHRTHGSGTPHRSPLAGWGRVVHI